MFVLNSILPVFCLFTVGLEWAVGLSRNKRDVKCTDVGIDGQYCMLANGKAHTYSAARKACKDAGGALATPRDSTQLNLLTAVGFPNYAWIDITDVDKEGSWVYADGSAVAFTSWGVSEPNNAGSGEDCAITPASGLWADVPCDVAYGSAVCWFNKQKYPAGKNNVWDGVLDPFKNKDLRKRFLDVDAEEDNYVAELLLVVDPEFVRQYQKFGYSFSEAKSQIAGDLKYYIYEINKKYKTLTSVNLEIRISHISFTIPDVFGSDDVSGGKISTTTSSDRFRSWIKTYNIYSHDVSLLLTGYSFSNGYVLNGYTEQACSQYGLGVVGFDGTYGLAKSMSISLGKLLGDNGCTRDQFTFSSCSDRAIKKYMTKLDKGTNCLTSTTTSASTDTFADFKNRDILNRDQSCKRALKDSTGFFCTYPYGGNVAGSVCKSLWCGKAGTGTCYGAITPEGMTCDTNKRCSKGVCLATPSIG